jgi:hypothetical protein
MSRLTVVKTICIVVAASMPVAGMADFAPITTKSEFVQKVAGKDLTMLGIRVTIDPVGGITGRAMGWNVSGDWTWMDGYFCRNMTWGGDDLGYNCQAVSTNGIKVRFQSDKGTGQSADLRLR